jgi:cytochrome P450
VQSLFKAKQDEAYSLTGESPLRPILGPNSVLTTWGERHMRQRKLLLPPFHGDAVERYAQLIAEVAEREIDGWPIGKPFALVPRMQAVTLAVIMGGIFGIEGTPEPGSVEGRFYTTIRRFTKLAMNPLWRIVELRNLGRLEASGALRRVLDVVDRDLHAVIAKRRSEGGGEESTDILSLLLATRDEDGQPLTDEELRDELMALLLAGHETTANSLSWAVERLLRTPRAYDRLREEVRSGDRQAADAYVEATIHETMRDRPVIPLIARTVTRPWRLGRYVVAAGTPVAVSILALHHRDDLYPAPQVFAPERFLGRQPGTYTWIPFGGGIRRCLGATLAMAEQRLVLAAIARRTDLAAADPRPESPRMRNVTMIPGRGCRVTVVARR